ncbi:MAG: 2,3-bisphosphoglycerate-independent phosphoglycerate mutase [Pseudomonadota bacterium]
MPPKNKKPVVLIIMDGYGIDPFERMLFDAGINVAEYNDSTKERINQKIIELFNENLDMFIAKCIDGIESAYPNEEMFKAAGTKVKDYKKLLKNESENSEKINEIHQKIAEFVAQNPKKFIERMKGNAIVHAKTPVFDGLWRKYPHTLLQASSEQVGLPEGQMGNSEVGHLNIGAGRIVETPGLTSINEAIKDKIFEKNAELNEYINKLQDSGGVCHLSGLLSDGGVHSHQNHIAALANYIISQGVTVKIHAILDGRDTTPPTALKCIKDFKTACPDAEIVTIGGRYYGMDRDGNWNRIKLAYDTMAHGTGKKFDSVEDAIEASYKKFATEEQFIPCVTSKDFSGIKDGDGFLFTNFRADRAEQICKAFANADFNGFERGNHPTLAATLGMCQYSAEIDMKFIFEPAEIENTAGKVLSKAGLIQARLAETEKYAHVTYFFDGGERKPKKGQRNILVESPKVETYDMKPGMSAEQVKQKVLEQIDSTEPPDFIVVNFANPDMVGHTGNMVATVKAVEVVDKCVGEILDKVKEKDGVVLITADHGNADSVLDAKDNPDPKHTTNPVPFIIAGDGFENFEMKPYEEIRKDLSLVTQESDKHGNQKPKYNGILANIAATVLEIMGIEIPKEMTHPPLQKFMRQKQPEIGVGV